MSGKEVEQIVRKVIRDEIANDELLTKKMAVSYVHVSEATLEKWLKTGRLPHEGEGKFTRIRKADLIAALKAPSDHVSSAEADAFADAVLKGVR